MPRFLHLCSLFAFAGSLVKPTAKIFQSAKGYYLKVTCYNPFLILLLSPLYHVYRDARRLLEHCYPAVHTVYIVLRAVACRRLTMQ